MFTTKSLLFIFTILLSVQASAFRYAYTTNIKTVVYADQKLRIPIGYIKSARKIKVGDKALQKGTITTLLVTGRIAYVQLKDITFHLKENTIKGAPKLREHDVGTLFLTDEDKLKEHNYIVLELSQAQLGGEWDELNERLSGSSDTSNAAVFSTKIEHRSPAKNYGFAIGVSYLKASEEMVKLSTIYLDFEYQLRLIQTGFISIEGLIGVVASGELKVQTIDGEVSNSVMYGYKFGVRARIFPFSKIGFFGSIENAKFITKSFEPITTVEINDYAIESLGGVKVAVGISFKL